MVKAGYFWTTSQGMYFIESTANLAEGASLVIQADTDFQIWLVHILHLNNHVVVAPFPCDAVIFGI